MKISTTVWQFFVTQNTIKSYHWTGHVMIIFNDNTYQFLTISSQETKQKAELKGKKLKLSWLRHHSDD